MQKGWYWVCSLFGFMVLYGLVFYGVISLPYALHDDFYMWMYDPRKNYYGHSLHYFLAFIGRPLAGQLVSLGSYFVHTIADVSCLRLASVLLCALSAACLAFWLTLHRVDGRLAFLAGAGAFLAPGLQTAIIWSHSVPIVATVFVSILAGLVLLPVKTPPEVAHVFAKKSNIFWVFLATAMLVTGLYTYQPSVMIFLVFPLARILVSSGETSAPARKKLEVDIGVFVSSCVVYFVSNRFVALPYYFARFPQAEADMEKIPQYQFKLLSLAQAPEKASLFFKQLAPNALDLLSYDFDLSWKVVSLVLFVILAGAMALFFRRQRQTRTADEKRQFVSFYFWAAVMVIALFLMGNAPGLLARGSHASARIYVSSSAMVFLLLCWAVFHVAGVVHKGGQTKLSRMILGAVVAALCFTAQHNTLRSAYLSSVELKYLESQIAPHIPENPRYHIIRARWAQGDVYTPSSWSWVNIPWMVRSIYAKYGKEAGFNPSKVTSGTWVDPYEKAPNLVVVDANRITDTIYLPPSGFPPVTLVRKDYMDFDIINIANPPANRQRHNLFFAVSAGEYDLEKKSCPPGGCSKVFAGPTLESVIEWVNKLGGESTVTASSELNGSFGAANVMTDASPVWHSQSPPKYPEWIRIDYRRPIVVTGFHMQSQPPVAGGEPVHTRMPRDFVLQASQDGEHWADLLKVQGAAFTLGEEWKDWSFANSVPYRHYRLYITANNGHPALIAIYHLKLKMAGESLPVAIEVKASSELDPSVRANNLAGWQGDASPWHSQKPARFPEWVRIAYSEPAVLSRLRIQSQPPDNTGNPQLGRAPRDFIVQGSQDGKQWTDLFNVQGAQFTGAWEWQEWLFDNKTAYKYYRLYITATNGDPTLVSMNRLQFVIPNLGKD